MYNEITAQKSRYFVITYDLILPLTIIVGILMGGWILLMSSLFSVKEVTCVLDYQACEEGAIKAELEKYKGANLIRLETVPIRDRLTAGDFTIRDVTFHKKLPSTLVVDMQSVYPKAAVKVKGVENEWIVFDTQYRVIGKRTTDPNVPTVLVTQPPNVRIGQKIEDSHIMQAIEFATEIGNEIYSVENIALENDGLYIALNDGKTAILSTTKERGIQIRTLQAILADTTISKDIRTIDVRFAKPVLK